MTPQEIVFERTAARIEACLYLKELVRRSQFGSGFTGAEIKAAIESELPRLAATLRKADV